MLKMIQKRLKMVFALPRTSLDTDTQLKFVLKVKAPITRAAKME